MRADQLAERYPMTVHEENGKYYERHYVSKVSGRPASGSTMFYVGPEEHTSFHRIDCDEYWCYHAGSTLEIWIVDPSGALSVKKFGVEDGADPLVYFPAGVIFASRHDIPQEIGADGTLFSCVTVPRFDYRGFELVSREKITELCPETECFFWKKMKLYIICSFFTQ